MRRMRRHFVDLFSRWWRWPAYTLQYMQYSTCVQYKTMQMHTVHYCSHKSAVLIIVRLSTYIRVTGSQNPVFLAFIQMLHHSMWISQTVPCSIWHSHCWNPRRDSAVIAFRPYAMTENHAWVPINANQPPLIMYTPVDRKGNILIELVPDYRLSVQLTLVVKIPQ